MKVGVLALQGAFALHAHVVQGLGVAAVEVRTPSDLDDVDHLVLPGGESTTMSMLAEREGLLDPLAQRIAAGMPVFGTCAGAILLAAEILDGRDDQRCLGALDISVRRNSYGPQIESFESEVDVAGLTGGPFRAVCIRAPSIERVADGIEVMAQLGDRPVAVRRGAIMATVFHPELSGDDRLHRSFLGLPPADQVAGD